MKELIIRFRKELQKTLKNLFTSEKYFNRTLKELKIHLSKVLWTIIKERITLEKARITLEINF